MSKKFGLHYPKMNPANNITVLGFDPGIDRLGWGIVSGTSFNEHSCLAYGLITTNKKASMEERLLETYRDIETLINKYKPTAIYTEKLFFARNVTTAFIVSEVKGIIKVISQKNRLPHAEIHPGTLKKRITGNGKAKKNQIRFMVQKIFGFDEMPSPDDVADGIAIAYCGFLEEFMIRKTP